MLRYTQELENWSLKESPLVSFSRSLRMEAPASGTSEDGKGTETDPAKIATLQNPLADIDLDDLPDDVREKIEAANKTLADATKNLNDTKVQAVKAEELARNHQSRADRNFELLRKHNMVDGQGNPTVSGSLADPEQDAMEKELTASFITEGMDAKQAASLAKIQARSFTVMGKNLMQQMGKRFSPVVESVSDMHATRLLENAVASDASGIFDIPEVDKSVRETLQLMVSNGATIIPETIENIRDMAYGKFLRGGGKQVEPSIKPMTRMNTRGVAGSGGQFAILPSTRGNDGKPAAANAETQAAMDATVQVLTKGLPKKGAK